MRLIIWIIYHLTRQRNDKPINFFALINPIPSWCLPELFPGFRISTSSNDRLAKTLLRNLCLFMLDRVRNDCMNVGCVLQPSSPSNTTQIASASTKSPTFGEGVGAPQRGIMRLREAKMWAAVLSAVCRLYHFNLFLSFSSCSADPVMSAAVAAIAVK